VLTGDLVQVRIKGKTIHPRLVPPDDPRLLELAGTILGAFHEACAEAATRGHLTGRLRELAAERTDHKLIGGLGKVLLDQCDFDTVSPLPPAELRALVFGRAAERGPLDIVAGPLGHTTAADVLAEVAAELETTSLALQQALYADLKDEQVLVKYRGPGPDAVDGPERLLHRYNVALVQALLLRASSLRVKLAGPDPKRLRQLFRYVKFFQLMYRLERVPSEDPSGADGVILELDGPQSLLRQSTRYGRQLATFLPAVLLQPGAWRVEAEVLWGKRRLRKELRLNHKAGLRSHYRDTGTWISRTEQWFVERWEAVSPDWSMGPGELIELGGQRALVPDLTFRKDGRTAHLDIVGYWRKGYLRKRLAETPDHVILAVSKRLAGDKVALPKTLQKQVLLFAEVIPVNEVVRRLEAIAR